MNTKLPILPALLILGVLLCTPCRGRDFTEKNDADLTVKVAISEYGYEPDHPKLLYYLGDADAETFEILHAGNGAVAYSGPLTRSEGDFGTFRVGDFSELTQPGEYFARVGSETTFGGAAKPFVIAPNRWDNLQQLSGWQYFGLRRIGEDSVMGFLGDMRGVRWDDARMNEPDPIHGEWKSVGTALGDGDDWRVYPSVSLVAAQYCALKETDPFWDRNHWIYWQVRWCLDGALSFLEDDGRLKYMLRGLPDPTNSTDGKFRTGDEKPLGDAFNRRWTVNEYHPNRNHEVVHSTLLIGPAMAVALYREMDPEFFDRVEALVVRGYDQILRDYQPFPPKYSLGAWIWLNNAMWHMTGEAIYQDRAVEAARSLIGIQVTEPVDAGNGVTVRGWYPREAGNNLASPSGAKPEQEIMIVPWIYQGLFRMIRDFPDHPDAELWRESVEMYARDYLMTVSQFNTFGFTPMMIDASGRFKRDRGEISYQYFTSIGRSFHQMANAAFLLQAGKILNDEGLINAAWRQAHWFSGANLFGYAMINGLGNNVPSQQHRPDRTGQAFPGGLTNGLIGDEEDMPIHLYNEYYTYANIAVLWFATVEGAQRFPEPVALWPRQTQESPHTATPDEHERSTFPVRLKGGSTYPFTAVVRDDPEQRVNWFVNGVPGGNPEVGTISPTGVYQAPYITERQDIQIRAESAINPEHFAETPATLMPVPRQVTEVRLESNEAGEIIVHWEPLSENVSGYTIWKRAPITDDAAGTVFRRIQHVGDPNASSATLPEIPILPGSEIIVRPYHYETNEQGKVEWIYGYGPDSPSVAVEPDGGTRVTF